MFLLAGSNDLVAHLIRLNAGHRSITAAKRDREKLALLAGPKPLWIAIGRAKIDFLQSASGSLARCGKQIRPANSLIDHQIQIPSHRGIWRLLDGPLNWHVDRHQSLDLQFRDRRRLSNLEFLQRRTRYFPQNS